MFIDRPYVITSLLNIISSISMEIIKKHLERKAELENNAQWQLRRRSLEGRMKKRERERGHFYSRTQ